MYQNIVKKYFNDKNDSEFEIFDKFFQKKIEKHFSNEEIRSNENDEQILNYFKDFEKKSSEIAKLFSVLKNK